MRRILSIAVAFPLLFGFSALAQDTSKVDVFLGYSFLRYNSAQTVPAFSANGGIGTLGYNLNDHVGVEAEFGGYHNGNINNYQIDNTSFSFLFGPRYSIAGRSKKVDPYIHALFGGDHVTWSIASDSLLLPNPLPPGITSPSDGRFKNSQTTFGMAVGGGVDIKLSRAISFRPIQLDYFLTRFETPSVLNPLGTPYTARNQNNLRYAAGFQFNFGAQ